MQLRYQWPSWPQRHVADSWSTHCPSQYEDSIGGSIKNLAEVKVDDIYCSPPINPAGDAFIEGYEVG